MLRNSLPIALLLILTLAGCTTRQAVLETDFAAELASVRAEGDHARALDIVDRIPNDHPQAEAVRAQRDQILKDIELVQQQRVAEAERLSRSGRWQEAYAVLDDASRQWRRSDLLATAYQELEQRQQLRYHQLQADLLLAEARTLQGTHTTVQQLATLTDRRAQATARDLGLRRDTLSRELRQLGHIFADQKDWQRTRDLLASAAQLAGDNERDPILIEAERQLASVAHRQERARAQRIRQQGDELIERYRRSESVADLVAARDFLARNNQGGTLDETATRLEGLSRERFRAGLAKGDTLYAGGDYAAAERAWSEVAPLYPGDPELAAKRERVKRVLDNLRSLAR
ncbi:MAG: hypothetical protein ACK4SX_14650 [Alcanivoracaceae bacterium]